MDLLIMKWPCRDCGEMLKKGEREPHKLQYDHKIADKGIIIKPEEPKNTLQVVTDLEPTRCRPVINYGFFKSNWTGNARKDYPNTYALFDKLKNI